MKDAEILARIIVDIDRLLTAYVEPAPSRDANLTIEEIISAIDRQGGMDAAQRILAGYTGPKLVK
jgi:hypothetical protein